VEEVIDSIRAACAGKTVDEIADEIRASTHAEAIEDIDALARYFSTLAEASAA